MLSRAEAVEAGGRATSGRVEPRIGDVVAACTGTTVVTRPATEPVLSELAGQHGSLTEDQFLIPLLTYPP